jgi:hypothetical protein
VSDAEPSVGLEWPTEKLCKQDPKNYSRWRHVLRGSIDRELVHLNRVKETTHDEPDPSDGNPPSSTEP